MENDRTWPLNVIVHYGGNMVEKKNADVEILVRGEYAIGHVMALIGQKIGTQHDWSDHALWWPSKKRWLKHCRMTLDQLDVCRNTRLEFRPMHQTLRIQFPDLNVDELKVDFSVNVLTAVAKLCQVINISHPEEWSLARPLTNRQLKRNDHHLQASPLQRFPVNTSTLSGQKSNNNIYTNHTINHSSGSLLSQKSYTTISSNGSSSMNDSNHSLSLSSSLSLPNNNPSTLLPHPKTSVQKARLNSAWLNSSISLFEQDVCENDLLLLKIKYYAFHQLKSSELTRVNYLYENLKRNILQEEISCTEDEMYTLAAIMLQVSYCIDCALETLEKELQTTSLGDKSNGKSQVPILDGQLKISSQKIKNATSTLARIRSTITGDRTYYAIFRETTLYAYRNTQDLTIPAITLDMVSCEVNPDVLASQHRYCFQIIDSNHGLCYYVKCQDESQYAKWFAACKQATHGHTMAHSSYDQQYSHTLKLLQVQSKFSQTKNVSKQQLKSLDIEPSHFIAPRFLKRKSKEQILARIKTAHELFNNNTLIEAQMNFIQTCQTLKDYAITLFVIRFYKSKKEDLLGAMPDKLVLIDINNGTLKKTWRYKKMIDWNINWEVKRMSINFGVETLEFECISADCKKMRKI
ncbi:Fermitin 2 [Dermatophagoides pteronyssinus]|uniref:Fermitin 2 n=1 Tax=Dermatophagoides pteronyssinus TaxID=6956 RepID=A0ABQ8IXK9_DERPT|nr:Fermitin 2 [Dermatophagoides pteronyssinus]